MEVFSFDSGLTFWALVTFACLFLLLTRFAFKPLQRILKEREDKIQGSLEAARQAREEADALLRRNQQGMTAARDETRRVINEGQRIVSRMKQEARNNARQQADEIVAQARTEIDRELQKGLDDLKRTVAGLSVRISRQILREQLDEERHQQLADEFVERLKKSHASRAS